MVIQGIMFSSKAARCLSIHSNLSLKRKPASPVHMTSVWVSPSEAVADPGAPQLRQEMAVVTVPRETLRSSTLMNFQLLISTKSRRIAKFRDSEMNLVFKVCEDYSDTDTHCNMHTLNVTYSKGARHFDNSKQCERKPVAFADSPLQIFVYSCMDSISYCCFLFSSCTVLLSKQVISLSNQCYTFPCQAHLRLYLGQFIYCSNYCNTQNQWSPHVK